MPYVKIETSKTLDESSTAELLKKTSGFISNLVGKPEQYIMISINQGTKMMFGGDTKPVAYVELKSIGLQQEQCAELSKALCNFIQSELDVSPDRVFIEFTALNGKMFGWDGSTF